MPGFEEGELPNDARDPVEHSSRACSVSPSDAQAFTRQPRSRRRAVARLRGA